MATSFLRAGDLEFKNGASSLCKLAGTADVLTLSGAGGNVELKGLAAPTGTSSAATKSYVDSAVSGLHWHDSCVAATTAAGTLATDFANGSSVDGVSLTTGDRLLIKNQSDPIENGIYVVAASSAPARAADLAAGSVVNGEAVFVSQGTVNADSGFVITSDDCTVGTDAMEWTLFTALGQITAGAALSKTGSTLNVEVDDTTIEVSGDALRIKDAGVANAKLATPYVSVQAGLGLSSTSETINLGTAGSLSVNVDDSSIEISGDDLQVKALGITNAMLAGSVANAKLTNSSVSISAGDGLSGGGSVALGSSITVDVDATVLRTSGNQSAAGVLSLTNTTQSTSTSTGALILSGGLGCAKDARVSGDVYATSFVSSSDAKLKRDVQEIKESKLDELKPVSYYWIDVNRGVQKQFGLIAQDLQKVYPCLVHKSEDHLAINYQGLISLLICEVQALKARVDEIEKN